jgi:oxygen-dependent protoporphyrinogen oxidase
MKKKRIIILGAGISGLSLAYFLSKRGDCEITVIEKKQRAGGWMTSNSLGGFLFEEGPRTFLFSRCVQLRALASELGLGEELILSAPEGKGRYLWIEGKLHKVPLLSGALVKSLLKEWRVPPVREDETVWDFACRRFNPKVAMHFFDPMVTGIYAGDIKKLSVGACFPSLKKWEERWGSITKGLWQIQTNKGRALFAFARGVQSLVDQLEIKSGADFRYGEEVSRVEFTGNTVCVRGEREYEGDYLFSALPCHVAGKLLDPELLQILQRGATVVNLGYYKPVLDKKGYGYIVSSQEQEEVLGVIFDSNAFPRDEKGTRLTVMLKNERLEERQALEISLEALKRHLGLTASPAVYQVIQAEQAFPQMEVGHLNKIQALEKRLQEKYPNLRLVGNYLYGVGVEDCVARAKSVSESFLRTVES